MSRNPNFGPKLSLMLGAACLSFSAMSLTAPASFAQAAKAPVAQAQAQADPDMVEQRIADLHSRLAITQAQESKWSDVAKAMRDNSASMRTTLDKRSAGIANMTAVEELRMYATITNQHADGLKKLVPAFERLYETLTPDQKKTADALFRRDPEQGPPAGAPAGR